MEPTSSTCAVASLTCSQLALVATGTFIIGLAILYTMKKQKRKTIKGTAKSAFNYVSEKSGKAVTAFKSNFPNQEEKQTDTTNFSLLLITTSEKIRNRINGTNVIDGEYNQSVELEVAKNLINTSRYFLIDNAENSTLQEAKTSDTLPDLEKDNLFILKITGQGKHNIATCKTKLALRDSITSESCKIEKVLHLLDARIAEKFIPTI